MSESTSDLGGGGDWPQQNEAEPTKEASPTPARAVHPVWAGMRWLLVIPAGLLAALAATFPIHWVVLALPLFSNEESSFGLDDLPPETLERMAYALFTPLVFIFVGSRVAPRLRIQASWALAFLWGAWLGALYVYVATSDRVEFNSPLEAGAAAILGVGGIVGGVAVVRGDNEPT